MVNTVAPVYAAAFRIGCKLYTWLPSELLQAALGLSLAFCGGGYCAAIAAVDAFRICGWARTRACLLDLRDEARHVLAANAADESREAARNERSNQRRGERRGERREQRETPAELLRRKLSLMAESVKDPRKLASALGGLYTAWLAVQGTLRLRFARAITLSLSLSESISPAVLSVTAPICAQIVEHRYHHWIPLIVESSVRLVALCLAWRLQAHPLPPELPLPLAPLGLPRA